MTKTIGINLDRYEILHKKMHIFYLYWTGMHTQSVSRIVLFATQ